MLQKGGQPGQGGANPLGTEHLDEYKLKLTKVDMLTAMQNRPWKSRNGTYLLKHQLVSRLPILHFSLRSERANRLCRLSVCRCSSYSSRAQHRPQHSNVGSGFEEEEKSGGEAETFERERAGVWREREDMMQR